jgi:hypothetical protein
VVVGPGTVVVVGFGATAGGSVSAGRSSSRTVEGGSATVVEGAVAASDVIGRVAPPSDRVASPAPSPTIATVTAVTLSIHFLAVVVMTADSFGVG